MILKSPRFLERLLFNFLPLLSSVLNLCLVYDMEVQSYFLPFRKLFVMTLLCNLSFPCDLNTVFILEFLDFYKKACWDFYCDSIESIDQLGEN